MKTLLNYNLDKKEKKPEGPSSQTIADIQSRLVNLINKEQQAPNMPQAQQSSGFGSIN